MASEGLHERRKDLRRKTRDTHRAMASLGEELEAIDWYRQRADACRDAGLKAILVHNMREEMEHAAMLVEWLRRRNRHFHHQLERYLFSEGPITETEAAPETGRDSDEEPQTAMTIGSLKE